MKAEENRILAESETVARRNAQFEADNNVVINDFLSEIISAAQPNRMGRDVTVLDAVKATVDQIDDSFSGQPRVEATLRYSVGKIYRGYGSYRAIEQFRKSLALFIQTDGEESDDTLRAMNGLAGALRSLGETYEDVQESRTLRERVLKFRRKMHGDAHEKTLSAVNNLAVVCNQLGEHKKAIELYNGVLDAYTCLLYTSPSPRDQRGSRMPSSA